MVVLNLMFVVVVLNLMFDEVVIELDDDVVVIPFLVVVLLMWLLGDDDVDVVACGCVAIASLLLSLIAP